jgi:micrococcal nuclease
MWTYRAKVAKVVDGDTLDLDVDLGFRVTHRVRARLARIDTAETSTPEGKQVKVLVAERVPVGTDVMIVTGKGDRYGRWIAEIATADGLNLSDWLLAQGLAVHYA